MFNIVATMHLFHCIDMVASGAKRKLSIINVTTQQNTLRCSAIMTQVFKSFYAHSNSALGPHIDDRCQQRNTRQNLFFPGLKEPPHYLTRNHCATFSHQQTKQTDNISLSSRTKWQKHQRPRSRGTAASLRNKEAINKPQKQTCKNIWSFLGWLLNKY